MPDTRPITLASAAALALVLGQAALTSSALATESQPAPAQAAAPESAPPGAPATPPAPSRAESARAKAEERRAAMMAERQKRYEELRASAAELGVDLPEPPPWESARSGMPAMHERMRAMSPEDREAMREAHWQRMRADAAERGIEMPETPPWVEAQQRREEMTERFEQYRKTIEDMSEEQREAVSAMFGRAPEPPVSRMPRTGYGHGYGEACDHTPWGYSGYGPYSGAPRGMAYPPMRPYQDFTGYDQGPPSPQ